MPPAYVKPYVKRGKTDAAAAEAICEAVTRPTMRFVAVKSEDQQAALMLHKTRDLLVRQRTMLINALRAHLGEYGIVVTQGEQALTKRVDVIREMIRGLRQGEEPHGAAQTGRTHGCTWPVLINTQNLSNRRAVNQITSKPPVAWRWLMDKLVLKQLVGHIIDGF